jgi:hypothetical protein
MNLPRRCLPTKLPVPAEEEVAVYQDGRRPRNAAKRNPLGSATPQLMGVLTARGLIFVRLILRNHSSVRNRIQGTFRASLGFVKSHRRLMLAVSVGRGTPADLPAPRPGNFAGFPPRTSLATAVAPSIADAPRHSREHHVTASQLQPLADYYATPARPRPKSYNVFEIDAFPGPRLRMDVRRFGSRMSRV